MGTDSGTVQSSETEELDVAKIGDTWNVVTRNKLKDDQKLKVSEFTVNDYSNKWYGVDIAELEPNDQDSVRKEVLRVETEKAKARIKNISIDSVKVCPPVISKKSEDKINWIQMDVRAALSEYSEIKSMGEMIQHYLKKDHTRCSGSKTSKVKNRGILYLVHEQTGKFHCSRCARAIERAYFGKPKHERIVGEYAYKAAEAKRIPANVMKWSLTNKHTHSVFYKRGVCGPCDVEMSNEELVGLKRVLVKVKSGTMTICGDKVEQINEAMFLDQMNNKSANMKRWQGWSRNDRFNRKIGSIIEETREMMRDFKALNIRVKFERHDH